MTWSSPSECASCSLSSPVHKLDANKTCVSIGIPNCILAESENGVCTQCATDYYVSSTGDACIKSPIANCIVNSTATLCAKCSPKTNLTAGYYLSTDKLSCIPDTSGNPQIESSCADAQETTLQCSLCAFGYIFESATRSCKACGGDFSGDNGCAHCNPLDTLCLFCKPGYHMLSTLKCEKDVISPTCTCCG